MSLLACDSSFHRKKSININGSLLDLSQARIMGILNITPDSFFDGGRYNSEQLIRMRIKEMIDEGVDVIDLGAVSSRPGAALLTEDEEWGRLSPVLDIIKSEFATTPLSIDTFRSSIVHRVFDKVGSVLVNDISGGDLDSEMFKTVSELKLPYMIMHMQGIPSTMQLNPQYEDVVVDICKTFARKQTELMEMGLNDLIIDPGFGFGKTLEQNYALLNRLEAFKIFELPIAVGLSRKSMIYKALECDATEALTGTIALNTIALNNGANILRVHDVKEAAQTIKLFDLLQASN